MKNLLIFIWILSNVNSYAQVASKRAIYKLKYVDVENNEFLIAASKQEGNLEFFLDFNNVESQFYVDKGMSIPNEKINLAIVLSNAQSTIFTNLKTTKIISQAKTSRMIADNEFIVTEDVSIDWEISNETKLIDGLKCFKATRKTITTNSNPKFKKKYIQTAWFCPKIPYSFGPTYSSGLPGLVVEYQDNNNFFYLKKIITLKEKFKFKKPKKGLSLSRISLNDTIAHRALRLKEAIEKSKEKK